MTSGEEAPKDGDWATLYFLPGSKKFLPGVENEKQGWQKESSRKRRPHKYTPPQEFITLDATLLCTATGKMLSFVDIFFWIPADV